MAGGVDLVDQPDQHALVGRPNVLDGHDVESRNQVHQHVADVAIGQLAVVEPVGVEGGDADGRALRGVGLPAGLSTGRRRSGTAPGDDPDRFDPLLGLLDLDFVVQVEVDAAADRRLPAARRSLWPWFGPQLTAGSAKGTVPFLYVGQVG